MVLCVKDMSDGLEVNEWELCAFFGSQHVSRQYGTEWFDSDSLYEKAYPNNTKLCFAIHPIHKDVRIVIECFGSEIVDWHGTGLTEISYIEENTRTILRLIGVSGHCLELQVTPNLRMETKVGDFYT